MKKLVLAAVVCSFLASCSQKDEKADIVVENYTVTSPVVVDTFLHTDYVAEINAVQNVEIRARLKGYLEKIYIDEGKYVQQGQVLFSINNPELKEEVVKAKAIVRSMLTELKAAELDLNNVKKLVDKNVVSKTELELAQNKVELASAKVEEAQANESFAKIKLTYTQIKAPFSGLVNRIPNKPGSLIEDGTLLTTISKNDEVFAYFDVSEKEYLDYADNLKTQKTASPQVTLLLANGEEHDFKGRIETSEGEIDQSTGNIAFRARFANPEKILKHGASGKVRLLQRYRNAMLIPQKATFEIQDRIYVYVIDNKNKVKSRAIKTTKRLPHFYIVDSGLSIDDRIIYDGIQNVKEGMLVNPQFLTMSKIAKELSKNDSIK
ncbi:efflux RND transporter periplasmic adaptor subunit [Flectobacillus major]|jgi:membrane fusion protein (multidrug efflux system)|uniref:efflux RND transporter periplasmic adaptor subunit n=1 Tax=Flectobacillus major TaxID=103 RepID=UPI00041F399C|nr:efflux RND transporter periplasmic adaptor subunit [Flectobacillus major]